LLPLLSLLESPALPSPCHVCIPLILTFGAETGKLGSCQVSPLPAAKSARGTQGSGHAAVGGVHCLPPIAWRGVAGMEGGQMPWTLESRRKGWLPGASKRRLRAISFGSHGGSNHKVQVPTEVGEMVMWGQGAHSPQRLGLHPGPLVLQHGPSPLTATAAAQPPAWNPCCHLPPYSHTSLLYLLSPCSPCSLGGNLDRQWKCMAPLRATWDPLPWSPWDFLLSAFRPQP
jgi:hypothetical protein